MPYADKSTFLAFAKGLRGELYNKVGATFSVDGWTRINGGYTQTKIVAITKVFTIKNILPPLTTKTNVAATDKAKQKALQLITNGAITITVTATQVKIVVTTATKPACDIDVIWYLEA